MTTNILPSKFNIPPHRPDTVLRQRLIDKLQQGLHRSLTLVSAPAGYGKTTLVSEWSGRSGLPAAWLSLEEGDGELSRFMTCLISSLQNLREDFGAGVLAVMQSPVAPPLESILTVLLKAAAFLGPFLLILDDYHTVNSELIDKAVTFLIDHLPAHIHMVIITRSEPLIPLARLRVQDRLTEIRAVDLRFTPAESEDFLNGVMGISLPAVQIEALSSRTEGWIAGLQLAALSIQGDQGSGRFIQSIAGSHHFVLDYLVEEVLQRQPAEVQAFLLRTSILGRLSSSLCAAVMPAASAAAGKHLLTQLERRNLFIFSLDQERQWYRYHHLFAESLQRQLRDSLAEEEIAELHIKASEWYEAKGYEIEAFRHAVEAADTERAARLLEGNGMPLHLRGAAGMVLKWLESLPAAELDTRPALWVMYGSVLLITGRPTHVEHKLRAAEAALRDMPQDERVKDLTGLIAATRAAVASLMMTAKPNGANLKLQAAETTMQKSAQDDKSGELIELIAPARAVRADANSEMDVVITQSRRALTFLRPDNLSVRTSAAWMLGVACQRQGDHAQARQAYNEVISYSRIIGHKLMAVMSLIGLGQIQEADNEPGLAGEYYEEALQLAGDLPLPALQDAQAGLERVRKILSYGRTKQLIDPLSQRELEVLGLIAKGLSNREISEQLFLALDTVKGHNRRIFEKLQVQRRTEAIARAHELHLLLPPHKPH
ncbi:LuxR family transcriptional regulator [Paenibacillus sp. PK3_47]|uniref:LuxR C-terminal-related transcriptional regulator n=1 Tax=Paenibacillus sp. PK3_47 TaxID=2072642 RepID=UPI00201D7BC0|nr:LuxR C-terminal-related transcriptional regulator [Paenibacillus sp. PK3_47]UQZ36738.1 LuxR family transcriptional regulator [Paenibacillus sp. PK3_47]